MRHFTLAVTAAASALACSQMAFAAEMPIKAPPPVAVASGNWYFWIDGMYENVRLPSVGLGFHNIDPVSAADPGPAQSFNQDWMAAVCAERWVMRCRVPASDSRSVAST